MTGSSSRRNKRPEMTPGAVRGFGLAFALVSLLATFGVWWLAALSSHERSELAAFQAAPACVATDGFDLSCRESLTAVVEDAVRHGGGKGGRYTSVGLRLTDSGLITARIIGASAPKVGEPVVVTLWRGKPALIQPQAPGRAAIATLTSPQYNVGNDATGILVLMAFVLGVGAAAWGFATYYLMRRRRAAPVHAVAAVLFAVVVTLRVTDSYGALAAFAYAGPLVFFAVIMGWASALRARVRAESEGVADDS